MGGTAVVGLELNPTVGGGQGKYITYLLFVTRGSDERQLIAKGRYKIE